MVVAGTLLEDPSSQWRCRCVLRTQVRAHNLGIQIPETSVRSIAHSVVASCYAQSPVSRWRRQCGLRSCQEQTWCRMRNPWPEHARIWLQTGAFCTRYAPLDSGARPCPFCGPSITSLLHLTHRVPCCPNTANALRSDHGRVSQGVYLLSHGYDLDESGMRAARGRHHC